MTFLETRTARERGLVYVAVILFVMFAIWQFGIKPVLDGKTRSDQAYASAMRDFDIVKKGLPRLSTGAQTNLAPFDRTSAIEVAGRLSLDIARMQPTSDGGQQIWFENAQSTSVLSFMADISSGYAAKISRVQITGRDSGFVSAQITLVPVT